MLPTYREVVMQIRARHDRCSIPSSYRILCSRKQKLCVGLFSVFLFRPPNGFRHRLWPGYRSPTSIHRASHWQLVRCKKGATRQHYSWNASSCIFFFPLLTRIQVVGPSACAASHHMAFDATVDSVLVLVPRGNDILFPVVSDTSSPPFPSRSQLVGFPSS